MSLRQRIMGFYYMIFLSFLSWIMFFVFYLQERKLLCPPVLFNAWWAITFMVDEINPYHLFSVSTEALLIIALGWFIFNLFSVLYLYPYHKKPVPDHHSTELVFDYNTDKISKFLFGTQIFIAILMLFLLIRIIPFYFSRSLLEIRDAAAAGAFKDGTVYMTTFQRLLFIHWLVFPLTKSLFVITSILWMTNKIQLKCFLIALVNMFFMTLICASRLPAFFAVIMLIFCLTELRKRADRVKKNKKSKWIKLLLACALVYIVVNGYSRDNSPTGVVYSILKSTITYFTGGMHLFTNALNNKAASGLNQYSFIVITFRGIISVCNQILYYCTGGWIPLLSSKFSLGYLDASNQIGQHDFINAFPTMYYYFMRDLGVLGVIVYTSIFAVIANMVYRKYKINRSVVSLIFLLEIDFIIFFSVCWWFPFKQEYSMQIVYYFVLFKLFGMRKWRNQHDRRID